VILFNLHSEDIVNKAFDEQDISIEITCVTVNDLRYADDTVLCEAHIIVKQLISK